MVPRDCHVRHACCERLYLIKEDIPLAAVASAIAVALVMVCNATEVTVLCSRMFAGRDQLAAVTYTEWHGMAQRITAQHCTALHSQRLCNASLLYAS